MLFIAIHNSCMLWLRISYTSQLLPLVWWHFIQNKSYWTSGSL